MNATTRLLVRMSDPERSDGVALTGAIDWAEFDRLALGHGVYPCLHHANLSARILPESLAEKAREEAEIGFARAHFFLHLADHYLAVLREGGVQALVLKGPALAFGVYPAPEMRPFSDIDLFIRERDNRRILEIFEKCGISLNKPELKEFNLREKSV